MRTRRLFLASLISTALGIVADASAQAYPSRIVTMVVPFAAGGPGDTLARILTERMRTSLGQSILSKTSPAPREPSAWAASRALNPTATPSGWASWGRTS